MRRKLHMFLDGHVKVVFDPPAPESQAHIAAILDLMKPLLQVRLIDHAAEDATKRLRALHRMKHLISGLGEDGVIYHSCRIGCHQSTKEVIDDLHKCFCELFLDNPPAPPASNKWNKLWPPVIWFGALLQISRLLPFAFSSLLAEFSEEDIDMHPEDLVGFDDERSFKRQEQCRFKKAHKFITSDCISDRMMGVLLGLKPCLQIMGTFFTSAKRHGQPKDLSLFTLIHQSSSPATRAIDLYISHLQDDSCEYWRPLVGNRPWTSELYRIASLPLLTEIGALFRRFIMALDCWPWRMALLIDENLAYGDRQAIAAELIDCENCCLDHLTQSFKSQYPSAVLAMSVPALRYLQDVALFLFGWNQNVYLF